MAGTPLAPHDALVRSDMRDRMFQACTVLLDRWIIKEKIVDKMKKLLDLMTEFNTAMLVTKAFGDRLDGRPMAIAKIDEDGGLWFVTNRHSGKVAEISAATEVCVTMQGDNRFVSISGNASIVDDRLMVERLWQEAWRPWFPQGGDDPSIILLHAIPVAGEYWDNSGLTGWRYFTNQGIAYFRGETPETDESMNAKLGLKRQP